jgi:hypothetical protein
VFAVKVDEHPAAVALLDVVYAQTHGFGSNASLTSPS